ncbi:rod shape-determining protein [Acinetobacter baumannii]|uniref:rod shape-determining protein n=1 Tax=Acinetobacter baumannii TaxID=470 RepID=UPI001D0E1FC0|nr:rod shape-determining protein [Acinetobacter baumannii]
MDIQLRTKMIREDLKQNPKAIWVHFYKNRMDLMSEDGTVKATEIPQIPYDHPRMILADFESATTTLKALMRHYSNGLSFLRFTAPTAIVQIMEPIQSGLTQLEIRAFKELFFDAGAREVRLYDLDGNSVGNK